MNGYLAAAAALGVLGGIVHSFLGERLIFGAIHESALPEVTGSRLFTKRILRVFWHLVSVAWWGFAAALWHLAGAAALDGAARRVTFLIAATFLASSLIALLGTRGRHFSWVLLLLIALLIGLGLR